jgi:hypothetical protein
MEPILQSDFLSMDPGSALSVHKFFLELIDKLNTCTGKYSVTLTRSRTCIDYSGASHLACMIHWSLLSL